MIDIAVADQNRSKGQVQPSGHCFIIIFIDMQALPSSFNPSDYEFLIKSLTQDQPVGKSESLKRLNTLVATDKKQFSGYAKRIVVVMQELLLEPRVPYAATVGRHQPVGFDTGAVDHQPQPERNRVLRADETAQEFGEEPGRRQTSDSQDKPLLPAGLCEDLPELRRSRQ